MQNNTDGLDGIDLERFKALQRLAYDCAETIAGQMQPVLSWFQSAHYLNQSPAAVRARVARG